MIELELVLTVIFKILSFAFTIAVLFQFKHYFCDYPWQTEYMLKKFLPGRDWILPLTAHAAVHAYATLVLSYAFLFPAIAHDVAPAWMPFSLAAFDFVVHFVMDRIKASPNLAGRYKILSGNEFPTATDRKKRENTLAWRWLGKDQMVHHLTHYVVIAFIMYAITMTIVKTHFKV